RGERFANTCSELTGDPAQGTQNLFFSRSRQLLLVEDLAGAAVPGAQPQHVLASEWRDGAFEHRGARGSFTDFPSDLRSEPRVRLFSHQTQYALDFLVRHQAEERRLFQLHRQALAQRSIEHGVAGLV